MEVTYIRAKVLNSFSRRMKLLLNTEFCKWGIPDRQNTTPDFQTIALNSLAIRLRSEDLHYLILGNKVPELQG